MFPSVCHPLPEGRKFEAFSVGRSFHCFALIVLEYTKWYLQQN